MQWEDGPIIAWVRCGGSQQENWVIREARATEDQVGSVLKETSPVLAEISPITGSWGPLEGLIESVRE